MRHVSIWPCRNSKVIALYLLYFSFLTRYNYILASPTAGSGYGSSFLHAKLLDRAQVKSSHRNPREELVHYLSSPLELDVTDPVRWWRVSELFLVVCYSNSILCYMV